MPAKQPPEPDGVASLKTAITYLRDEALRLRLRRVAGALQRALDLLDE